MGNIADILSAGAGVADASVGALSVIDNITGGAGHRARKTYRSNLKYAMKKQQEMTDWLWDKYDSPLSKTQAMLNAGLNPNLMYSQGANIGINAPSLPSAPHTPSETLPSELGLSNIVGNALLLRAQIKNIEADTEGKQIANEDNRNRVDNTDYYTQFTELPRAQAKREISVANLNDTDSLVHKAMQDLQEQIHEYTKQYNQDMLDWDMVKFAKDFYLREQQLTLQERAQALNEFFQKENVQLMYARLALDKRIAQSQMAVNGAQMSMLYSLGALHSATKDGVMLNNSAISKMLGPVPDKVFDSLGIPKQAMMTTGQSFVTWDELGRKLDIALTNANLGSVQLSNEAQEFFVQLQKYRYGDDLSQGLDSSSFSQGLARILYVLGINGGSLPQLLKSAK